MFHNPLSPLTGGAVTASPDLERILAIPKRDMDDDALADLTARMTEVLKTPNGTMTLRALQAKALYEIAVHNGGFFPLDVGLGKTLIALLAAHVLDAKQPVMILPAGLIDKTRIEREEKYDIHWQVPKHIRMISYEVLGRAEHSEALEQYPPDLIIGDEIHRLKNADAAVTKRVIRYMETHPETLFVALSGTIMDHSILEFGHILRWCLKGRSPVPLDDGELSEWAAALDVKAPRGNEFARYDVGPLVRLAEGAPGLDKVTDITVRARLGFQNRLVTTPGIVTASEGDAERVKASIIIRGIVYAPTKQAKDPTDKHFYRLRAEMKMTDDWDLTTPMEKWAHAREIALGLSYIWETRPPEEWLKPRKAWFKFVRSALKESSKFGGSLDSPLQVRLAVEDGTLFGGRELLNDWLKVEESFKPITVPVWHDDIAIDTCAKWAKTRGPGIIWTEHTLFAQRLAKKTGLKYYGQHGRSADGEIIDKAPANKSVIASGSANKEGRNLQQFSRNLITTLEPRPGKNQQIIGRTHRTGQLADEVEVDIMIGCLEHLAAWEAIIPAAKGVRATTGAEQKILLADVTAWPKPHEVATWTGARWVQPETEEFVIPARATYGDDEEGQA